MAAARECHGQLVRVAPTEQYHFHLVFSNKTQSDACCIEVWQSLTARRVTVWQQKKNIPKDSDNWFNEWYPAADVAVKIVCFLTVGYLKSPYCMKEFGIALAKGKLLVVCCEPLCDIMQVSPREFPHASNALAYLEGGGQVIFQDADDVVAEILKFIPRENAVDATQAEPEPEPAVVPQAMLAPAGAHANATAWPTELAEFVSLPPISQFLAQLGVDSLNAFAENVDLDEGHDTTLQQLLAALPDKPKKVRLQRNRAQKALADLLLRLQLFEEFDSEEMGSLSRVDCTRIPVEKMQARVGGAIRDQFDAIDTDKDGRISFAELFLAAEVSAGEGVPPTQTKEAQVQAAKAAAEKLAAEQKVAGGSPVARDKSSALVSRIAFTQAPPQYYAITESGSLLVATGDPDLVPAICSPVMQTGKSYATFTLVAKGEWNLLVGVCRPNSSEYWGLRDCFVGTYWTGKGADWNTDTSTEVTAFGQHFPFQRPGDELGLLLDSDVGSLTVKLNGDILGVVIESGLHGEMCWAVACECEGYSVRVKAVDPAQW